MPIPRQIPSDQSKIIKKELIQNAAINQASSRVNQVSQKGENTDQKPKPNQPKWTAKVDYGFDLESFVNEESQMFDYFRLGQFKVDPCQINTVDEAIDDYEIRKREF